MTVSSAYCQQLSIKASVDRNVLKINNQLTLRVEVSGSVRNVPKPSIPELKGFTVSYSGREQNISYINGKVSSSIAFTYILVPQSEGKHIIPAITINYKGQNYSTSPVEVEVLASAGTRAPAAAGQTKPQTRAVSKSINSIFITTKVDRKKVYVNEQIQLTFSFFNRARLLGQSQYSPANTTGFWSEDLPPQKNYRVRLDGLEYQVVDIKTALFPTSAGKHTIGKAQLKCSVEDVSGSRDDFFRFSRGKTVMLESNPINVTVLPLPEKGKPADFNGAVGRFSISAKVDKTKLKTNEAVTFTVDISGTGNVKAISEPVFGNLDSFRRYETVSSFNLSKDNYRVQGSKSYQIILSPMVSGRLAIPSVKFSYFDPQKKSYMTVKTNPINLNVIKGEKDETSSAAAVITPQGIKYVTKDIRYIKARGGLKDQGNLLYRKNAFLGFHVFPPVVLLGMWFYGRRVEKLNRDISFARRTRASSMVRKRLKKARGLSGTDRVEEFYAALSEGLTKFIGDKLNVSAVGMTMAQIEELLNKKKVEGTIVEDLKNIMSRSDFARFAPSQLDKNQLKPDYKLSENIIMKLQKYI